MSVKAIVLRCAGTNCNVETSWALEKAGAAPEEAHVNALLRGEKKLRDFGILVIPGGFSFGDDVASGKVLANKLLYGLREPLGEFIAAGKPVIGICNGFQVLVKCGLLPGFDGWDETLSATLTDNDSGKFEFLPSAPSVFRQLEDNGQILFRYVNAKGKKDGYPWNPNGSFGDVAGITSRAGNVLGLMPHPERHAFPRQHSHWTRLKPLPAEGVGLQIFKNAVRFAAGRS
jgi:phosphoribosylformylglycinamidine synthase